jgi:hypothetical protein
MSLGEQVVQADGIEVVELQHAGKQDRQGTKDEKGVPHEIDIASRGLFLSYQWEEEIDGYSLVTYDEQRARARQVSEKPAVKLKRYINE